MKKDLKSRVKMPEKKMPEMEMESDLDMLGEDLDMLEAEDEKISGYEDAEYHDMSVFADDELLKEIKKRGLSLDNLPEESEEIDEEGESDELEAIDLSEEEEI